MTSYAAPPTGAPPMAGPDDAETAAWDEHTAHERQVDVELRRLRARHDAQLRFTTELAHSESIPPFDAGFLADILDRPEEPAHRCEGIIPADAGTLLVAQRKTGKTTLELNLARSLIDGTDFLGRFPTTKIDGNVALLNYEVSAGQLGRWADEVGIDPTRIFLVNLRGRRNPLKHPGDRASLAERLRAVGTEALIVDPFGRAYTGTSQNDPGEVGAWLTDLDVFGRSEVGARDIALTTHAGWNGERTRGSTALEDWADTIITVTRDDDGLRYLRAEGRDVLVSEDQLSFDQDTRTLSLAGAGSRRAAAKTRQAEALMPLVADILAEIPSRSGNQLDALIKKRIADEDLDLKHSKGDGAKAANLLERRGMVGSKDGPRGARLYTLLTSPTSLTHPSGNSGDFPSSPIGREVAQGSPTTSPSEGTQRPSDRPMDGADDG
jgi:hypothetical protein